MDPQGIRTIGVVTMIDKLDRWEDVSRVIMNKEVNLRLGYIGVKNRSREDIENQMPLEEAMVSEREFFSRHLVYSRLPRSNLGCEALTACITRVLMTHFRHDLPGMVQKARAKIRETQEELDELGKWLPSTREGKLETIWAMISEFLESLKSQISGKFDAKRKVRLTASGDIDPSQHQEISFGSAMLRSFDRLYEGLESTDWTHHVHTDRAIELAILRHEGDSITGFLPVDVLESLMAPLMN